MNDSVGQVDGAAIQAKVADLEADVDQLPDLAAASPPAFNTERNLAARFNKVNRPKDTVIHSLYSVREGAWEEIDHIDMGMTFGHTERRSLAGAIALLRSALADACDHNNDAADQGGDVHAMRNVVAYLERLAAKSTA